MRGNDGGRLPVCGRQAELAVVSRFVDNVPAGLSALALRGDQGIGKTTIFERALERAEERSFTVLSVRAAETELQLSYAGLADLLAPVPERILETLPRPERQALEVALVRAEPSGDPLTFRASAAGTLAVLSRLAEESPVLVAVDDVQWLDQATERTLSFVFRRLRDQPIGLVFCQTGDRETTFGIAWVSRAAVQELNLGGLGLSALRDLIAVELGHALPRRQLEQVRRITGGNPLFALELVRSLPSGAGDELDLPTLPQTLDAGIRRRVAQLPRSTRDVLLIAASTPEPTVDMVDADAFHMAETADIVRLGHNGAIAFSSPLFAWAVRDLSTPQDRRRAHRRLAEIARSAEERLEHLALATDVPNGELAGQLDQAASVARGRGAPAASAHLLVHALRLTPAPDTSAWARRAAAAIPALVAAGEWEQAREVSEEALSKLAAGPERAAVLLEVANTRPGTGDLCRQALEEAESDPFLTIRGELMLTRQAMCRLDVPAALDHSGRAIEIGTRLGYPALVSVAFTYRGIAKLTGGGGDPQPDFAAAVELEAKLPASPSPIGFEPLTWTAATYVFGDNPERGRGILEAQLRRANENGDETSRSMVTGLLHHIDLQTGDWAHARPLIDEAVELADLMDFAEARGLLRAWQGRLLAQQGELDHAEAVLAEGRAISEATEYRPALVGYRDGACFLAHSTGRHAEALAHASELRSLLSFESEVPAWLKFETDELESLIALGESVEAKARIESLERRAMQGDRPRLGIWACRGRGLLRAAQGDVARAIEALDEALVRHEQLQAPFELGRTLLEKGKVERRARHKANARESLDQAIAVFERLGAVGWADDARRERARIGLRSSSDTLTTTERRVADLAAAGKTNREIAGELFMSRRTVESNLARVYRKLNLRSRTELAAMIAATPHDARSVAEG